MSPSSSGGHNPHFQCHGNLTFLQKFSNLHLFKFQVAIIAKGTATLRCGGALIAENYVLTSAYCAKL